MPWDTWWVWVVAGVLVGCLEVVVPGYIFLGFAIGAVLTGGLTWLEMLDPGLSAKLAVFAVLSLLAWVGLRQALRREGQVKIWKRDINDNN